MAGYKGEGKPEEFYPDGTEEDGHPVAAHDEYRLSDEVNSGINFPILGIINRVYFADLSTNHSNTDKNVYSNNSSFKRFDGAGNFVTSEFVTKEKGYRLEVDVKIVKGPNGVSDSGVIIENVPVCLGFGGITNYGMVVPTPTSNVSVPQYTGTENGDWCLVQYIGGQFTGRCVTHIWPNQLNTIDAPIAQEEIFAYARMAGTQILINKDGNFTLDARDAGQEVTTDPNTGAISNKRAGGNEGSIHVITRNDVVVAAGFPRTNESESSLPGGNAALKASRLLSLRSTLDEVAVNTQADADYGTAMQVKIQGERGSLRPAARKYDRVSITNGDSGNLFDFIDKLYDLLDSVATTLTLFSDDPGAVTAGSLIEAFIDNNQKPTYQTGKITTGSMYCQIAGKGTASDIGGDESGIIAPSTGEPVSSEELVDLEISALSQTIPEAVSKNVYPNLVAKAKALVPGTIQKVADIMSKNPFTVAYAVALKQASFILIKVEGILSAPSPPSFDLNNNLPSSFSNPPEYNYTSMAQVTGTFDPDTNALTEPGLTQEVDYYSKTNDYMQAASSGLYQGVVITQSKLETLLGTPNTFDTNDIPVGPRVKINPVTGTYWKVGDTFTTQAGQTDIIEAKEDYNENSERLSDVMGGFNDDWFNLTGLAPANVAAYAEQTLAVTTSLAELSNLAQLEDAAYSAVEAAITPVVNLVGEGAVEAANDIVDEDLSSL